EQHLAGQVPPEPAVERRRWRGQAPQQRLLVGGEVVAVGEGVEGGGQFGGQVGERPEVAPPPAHGQGGGEAAVEGVGVVQQEVEHPRQGASQSSRGSPGTRPNSCVLCVTSVTPWVKAIAAIWVSSGPIGVPRRSRYIRTWA